MDVVDVTVNFYITKDTTVSVQTLAKTLDIGGKYDLSL